MHYSLYNSTRWITLVERLSVADHFWQRLAGLMGKQELAHNEGLLIVPCKAVHTMFMRFPIDLLFLSRDFIIVRIIENLRPWRATPTVKSSYQVLELNAGSAARTGTAVGDKLSIVRIG